MDQSEEDIQVVYDELIDGAHGAVSREHLEELLPVFSFDDLMPEEATRSHI